MLKSSIHPVAARALAWADRHFPENGNARKSDLGSDVDAALKCGAKPTLVSLFTGAGGLDLGLEDAGFRTILANEIDAAACESLRQNRILRSVKPAAFDKWFDETVFSQRCFKKSSLAEMSGLRERLREAVDADVRYLEEAAIVESDVRSLTSEFILEKTGFQRGDIDLIAGGPPCQPFSRAGKRELVESDTGQLFLDFVRLVDGVRPRWFLFENVKGLVLHKADVAFLKCPSCSSAKICDFEDRAVARSSKNILSICSNCKKEELHEVDWKKIKSGSLDIIEHEFSRLGYKCYSKILNAADFGAPQSRERLIIIGSRDGESFDWPDYTHAKEANSETVLDLFESRTSSLLPWKTMREAIFANDHTRYGKLDDRAVLWVKNVVRPHDEPVTWSLDRVAPTVGAHQAAKFAIAPRGVPEEQLYRQQWHVLGRRQGDTPPVFVEHEYLSDENLLDLQTFPRSWYLHGTRMERAFQIGNAVPPTLARAIGVALITAMGINAEVEEKEEDVVARNVACI